MDKSITKADDYNIEIKVPEFNGNNLDKVLAGYSARLLELNKQLNDIKIEQQLSQYQGRLEQLSDSICQRYDLELSQRLAVHQMELQFYRMWLRLLVNVLSKYYCVNAGDQLDTYRQRLNKCSQYFKYVLLISSASQQEDMDNIAYNECHIEDDTLKQFICEFYNEIIKYLLSSNNSNIIIDKSNHIVNNDIEFKDVQAKLLADSVWQSVQQTWNQIVDHYTKLQLTTLSECDRQYHTIGYNKAFLDYTIKLVQYTQNVLIPTLNNKNIAQQHINRLQEYCIKVLKESAENLEEQFGQLYKLYENIRSQYINHIHSILPKLQGSDVGFCVAPKGSSRVESFVKLYSTVNNYSVYDQWIMQKLFGEHGIETNIDRLGQSIVAFRTKNVVPAVQPGTCNAYNLFNVGRETATVQSDDEYKQLFIIMFKSLIIGARDIWNPNIVGNKIIDCYGPLDPRYKVLHAEPFVDDVIKPLYDLADYVRLQIEKEMQQKEKEICEYKVSPEITKEVIEKADLQVKTMYDKLIRISSYSQKGIDALKEEQSFASKIIQMFIYSQCVDISKCKIKEKYGCCNIPRFSQYIGINMEKMLESVKRQKLDSAEFLQAIYGGVSERLKNLHDLNGAIPQGMPSDAVAKLHNCITTNITQLKNIEAQCASRAMESNTKLLTTSHENNKHNTTEDLKTVISATSPVCTSNVPNKVASTVTTLIPPARNLDVVVMSHDQSTSIETGDISNNLASSAAIEMGDISSNLASSAAIEMGDIYSNLASSAAIEMGDISSNLAPLNNTSVILSHDTKSILDLHQQEIPNKRKLTPSELDRQYKKRTSH